MHTFLKVVSYCYYCPCRQSFRKCLADGAALERPRLTLNFCHFDNKVFQQILGFASVTCGAEAADIYLHELLREEFEKVSSFIRTYKRFIDDAFLIWTGTVYRAEQLLRDLNTKLDMPTLKSHGPSTAEVPFSWT